MTRYTMRVLPIGETHAATLETRAQVANLATAWTKGICKLFGKRAVFVPDIAHDEPGHSDYGVVMSGDRPLTGRVLVVVFSTPVFTRTNRL